MIAEGSSFEMVPATESDRDALASLRVEAMRESLEAINRFDPRRARERFTSRFSPSATTMALIDGELAGFYVIVEEAEHLLLDHLYVSPRHQGLGIGSNLLARIFDLSADIKKPIRLTALKSSRSNDFYLTHDFRKTHESEFDNHYQRPCHVD